MLTPARGSKAFTLLELIVVIVILGILAGIAIPTFQKVIVKSKKASLDRTLEAVDRDARALAGFDQAGVTAAHLSDATGEVASSAGTFSVAADGTSVTLTKDALCRQLTIVQGASGNLSDCAAAPAVALSPADDFNRADSTTGLGTATTGEAWTAVAQNPGNTVGTLGISSNAAYLVATGSDGWAASVVEVGAPAKEVSVEVTGAAAGLVFRHKDTSNKFITYIYQGQLEVGYMNGGGYQVLTPRIGVTTGTGKLLRVTDDGTTINVYFGGSLVHTLTNTTHNTATQAGVAIHNVGGPGPTTLDNFQTVK